MDMKYQTPIRTGLLDFFRNSSGCQFVIPVYQRNYTWTAGKEVRQLLDDMKKVLTGEYNNHFLGIMIYLDTPLDFSAREFSVIDGQQRLTTTFLILYAIKELFAQYGMEEEIQSLEGQYLTNPFSSKKIKYKLKPLVSDDRVYQYIVSNQLDKIEDTNSNVYKNYIYIRNYLNDILIDYSINDILMALNKLYIVCVPISSDDNAQKIFESINATGIKLTASDLVRNFVLMDLPSDKQEEYYDKYWRNLERLLTSDSKKIESFIRFFLAAKTKTLPNKNAVYKIFVNWFNDNIDELQIEGVFQEIVKYAEYYYTIYKQDLSKVDGCIKEALKEFRRILSDMPAPLLMEFFNLYKQNHITGIQLNEIISITNSYLIRRALCDLDTSSITRLFPALLKDIIEDCNGNYKNIVEILKKNLINKNIGNTMYMPDDVQLRDLILNANMYNIRSTVRIFFDKLEHHNNPAPVDLSVLSIEHLMPQTPTSEWYSELAVDEDTYMRNVHRLGNLTLATKVDNSVMKNKVWAYKNKILADTSHLKINEELIKIEKWTIDCINKRTESLIKRIIELYPYPVTSTDIIPKKPIFIRTNNIKATGFLYLDNGSVEVDVGSELYNFENAENYPEIEDIRQELIEEKVVAETEKGLFFAKPYVFYSKLSNYTALSTSASVILHGSRNGWEYWTDDSGIPLCNIAEIKNKFSKS